MTAPFDVGDLHPRRYFATIGVVMGLLFALISNDENMGLGLLLLQWQFQCIVPMGLLLTSHLLLARLTFFERISPWWQLAASGVAGAALFAPVALWVDVVILGETGESLNSANLLDEFVALAPPILVTWLAINAPFVLGLRLAAINAPSAQPAMAGEVGPAQPPPFMALVPAPQRGVLFYLEAELHYLAVVTDRGRSLILYNLRDAVNELDRAAGVEGLQTHRAFWVSLREVGRFSRRGRQGVLLMNNGDKVPVSRRRMQTVKAAVGSHS